MHQDLFRLLIVECQELSLGVKLGKNKYKILLLLQVDDFELMEDGGGTMMDFNLAGDTGSQADYSPHDRPVTAMTSASQMSTRREFAL